MPSDTTIEQKIDRTLEVTASVLNEIIPVACSGNGKVRQSTIRKTGLKYCLPFCVKMQSDHPYQSEEEAINGLAPVAFWIFGWAARQFAILVIKALWRRWHQE